MKASREPRKPCPRRKANRAPLHITREWARDRHADLRIPVSSWRDARSRLADLYQDYRTWCEARGECPKRDVVFIDHLHELRRELITP